MKLMNHRLSLLRTRYVTKRARLPLTPVTKGGKLLYIIAPQ